MVLLELHNYTEVRHDNTRHDNAGLQQPSGEPFDEEQMAAASFLARYSGRTLDAYRDRSARASSSGPMIITSW